MKAHKIQPPHKVPRTTEAECRNCGRPFTMILTSVRDLNRKFCSHPCAVKFNHHARWGATVPERVIQALLVGMDIPFIEQWMFRTFVADIYLPPYNIAIECDGDYWHTLDPSIKATIKKDFAYQAEGIPVIHLTESDIKHDLMGCRERIRAAIQAQQNEHRDTFSTVSLVP